LGKSLGSLGFAGDGEEEEGDEEDEEDEEDEDPDAASTLFFLFLLTTTPATTPATIPAMASKLPITIHFLRFDLMGGAPNEEPSRRSAYLDVDIPYPDAKFSVEPAGKELWERR
jgi:hypothetical protein